VQQAIVEVKVKVVTTSLGIVKVKAIVTDKQSESDSVLDFVNLGIIHF
jgi:hypothetical protein